MISKLPSNLNESIAQRLRIPLLQNVSSAIKSMVIFSHTLRGGQSLIPGRAVIERSSSGEKERDSLFIRRSRAI